MLGMYLVIFIFIVKKRQIADNTNQKKTDRDTSLVVQALIITIALEVILNNSVIISLVRHFLILLKIAWLFVQNRLLELHVLLTKKSMYYYDTFSVRQHNWYPDTFVQKRWSFHSMDLDNFLLLVSVLK